MGRLSGRTVLVTGGANGAGAASVRLFCKEGARVAVVDRDDESGSALAKDLKDAGKYLKDAGHEIVFAHGDVSLEADANRAFHQTVRLQMIWNRRPDFGAERSGSSVSGYAA
ncbi:MAG: SDR family NAD(P)-dependent oxidoreductase [Rhizobiales bacterium]|nr:SDR family NAD(P)-dependent oxidoreductase [Hyphomicrobiales bacterium]